jgi:hypothetical protein
VTLYYFVRQVSIFTRNWAWIVLWSSLTQETVLFREVPKYFSGLIFKMMILEKNHDKSCHHHITYIKKMQFRIHQYTK